MQEYAPSGRIEWSTIAFSLRRCLLQNLPVIFVLGEISWWPCAKELATTKQLGRWGRRGVGSRWA